jgi:hypothetical protein
MVLADSIRISRVPTYSGYLYHQWSIRVRDFHPLRCHFPENFHFWSLTNIKVLQPLNCRNNYGLGFSPFDRHYLGNHFLFYFPPDTKMFQFSGFAFRLLGISRLQRDGLPHSEIRGYNGYLLLPAAYRSLSRPSSPLRAKAFTMRPYLLFSNIILLISLLF